jgi:hypothetical protein
MLFEDINVDPETGDVTIRIEVSNPEENYYKACMSALILSVLRFLRPYSCQNKLFSAI